MVHLMKKIDIEMVKRYLFNMNIDNFCYIFLNILNELLNEEMPQQIQIV